MTARLTLIACIFSATFARADVATPAVDVDIQEHFGQKIPASLTFRDEQGQPIALGSLFEDGKPVVMILEYFRCETLCSLALQALVASVSNVGWKLGKQFRVVAVSIDPTDTPAEALAKQRSVLAKLGQPTAIDGWRFLTGSEPAIASLADRLGFRYAFDPRTKQYAHPAAIYVLTPEGAISRYLYGVEYPVRDLKLALFEASQGRIGNFVERIILTCYRYDPSSRKYALYVSGTMQGGGIGILCLLALGGVWIWRVERRRRDI